MYSRGLGFSVVGGGTPCSEMPPVSSTFVGPFDCVGNQGDVPRVDQSGNPATQGSVEALWQLPQNTPSPSGDGTFADWFNKNAKTIGITAAVFIGLLIVSKR